LQNDSSRRPAQDHQISPVLQIAMLGGNTGDDDGAEGQEGGGRQQGAPGAAGAPRHPVPKGKATKPMGVNEFMDKGVGGAALPRKR
jgi:hypothetical protein